MSIEFGHFALVLAGAVAAVLAGAGFWGWNRDRRAAPMLRWGAILQFLCVSAALGALIHAFVTSDFSLALAHRHSHSTQPLLFKVTSVWGNHEGSMVLWILILAAVGAAVALFGRELPARLLALVLAVQSLLVAVFTGFALLTSNPFARLAPAPFEGEELNPVLQDIGLALHPPLLYAGYVGFSICFSFAVAALVSGRIDAAWARWVRPWALASWGFLTLGIAMGSYWAYYELGWGGWWFWDPVENASFLPWLAGIALLHSAIVMEKRDALKAWTVLLAIIAFSLSLLGTFLVRSGILTSVHSFAADPTRGLAILIILAALIGGALALFALRVPTLKQGGIFAPISREGALIVNNLFLVSAMVAVLTGTLYPLIVEAIAGRAISVGAPFFDLTFGALMAPLLVVLPFGPFMAWKRGDFIAVAQRLAGVAGAALFAGAVIGAVSGEGASLATLGLLLGFWVAFGALAELIDRAALGRVSLGVSIKRLRGLPRTALATALGHFGVGTAVIGIVAASAWQTEVITTLAPGDEVAVTDRILLRFAGVEAVAGENFTAEVGRIVAVETPGGSRPLNPQRRVYTASGTPTTEAAIETYGFSQLYVQLGDAEVDGRRVVRAWFKPYVTFIWLGALAMAAAAALSLTDRRKRVGAPKARAARISAP